MDFVEDPANEEISAKLCIFSCARNLQVSESQAGRPVALLFPDQNSKSLKMLKGLQECSKSQVLKEFKSHKTINLKTMFCSFMYT